MKPIDINRYQLAQEIDFTAQSLKSGIQANCIYMIIYLMFGLWWALLNNLVGVLLYHRLSKRTIKQDNLVNFQQLILTIYILQLSVSAFILLPAQAGIHFKSVNDRFGHDVGDDVLRELARTISQSIRESDIAGRIGG